jgi:hypothetical protein
MTKLKLEIVLQKKIINDIDKILENDNSLSLLTNSLLNSTTSLNKLWLEFYPEFSTTFNIRSNLTEVEYTELAKMRMSFDEIFPYAANLDKMTKDQNFIFSNFTELFSTIVAYYQKSAIYMDELSNILTYFNQILEQNQSMLGVDEKSNLMITQSISEEEILTFQNEFVEIIEYFKNFMSLIMNKVADTNVEYTKRKQEIDLKIDSIQKYIGRLETQKKNLYNLI